MKRQILLFACAAMALLANAQVINVTKQKVKGDGKTINTQAFNRVIQKAPEGAIIVVPAGKYLTGTIHLKSHMTLQLDSLAEILGVNDLNAYDHYEPTKDMHKYDSGEGSVNANLAHDARWTRALILGQNLEDVTITGKGTINGQHVVDSLGEESMRGPHGILIAESKNIKLENFTLRCASNYGVLGYELKDSEINGLTICEGWDGVHIRGAENVVVKNCDIKSGDDAVAGGYWNNMRIQNCQLNSSCNGLRMMEPSTNLTIQGCHIYGPGVYPHRTSGAQKRTSTIYGIVLQPGAWGDAPGHTENVLIKDCTVDHLLSPLVYSMEEDNTCSGLTVDGLICTHISFNTQPLNRQDCVRMWDNIVIKNMSVSMDK